MEQQIAQYFLWSVYINATTLLVVVGMVGYVLMQTEKDTREILSTSERIAQMTAQVLREIRER